MINIIFKTAINTKIIHISKLKLRKEKQKSYYQ